MRVARIIIILKKQQVLFKLVAYYTRNSIYEKSAIRLGEAAAALGVDCMIHGIDDRGGWCANTEYKPEYVLKCMVEYPGFDIAYTDADSMIHSYPALFDNPSADIIIRRQNFKWRQNEFMSGTFFVKNNEAGLGVVKSWAAKVAAGKTLRAKPDTWEQYRLGEAILESGVPYAQLPHEYIYFDHIERAEGFVKNPVFTHMQFSRQIGNKKA